MQGFGAKVDARLKELEAKYESLESLEKRFDALLEEICTTDEGVAVLSKRVAELEGLSRSNQPESTSVPTGENVGWRDVVKRRPGRPPKAPNGE